MHYFLFVATSGSGVWLPGTSPAAGKTNATGPEERREETVQTAVLRHPQVLVQNVLFQL